MTHTLQVTRPDDWHLHVRDGAALAAVVPDTARRFGRALIILVLPTVLMRRVGVSLSSVVRLMLLI